MILESVSFLDPEDLDALPQPAISTGKREREEELALGVECAWPPQGLQL
jgi:hypothetical protein